MSRRIVVTGTAGFIGFHTAKKLLDNGDFVIGIDSLTDYYDVQLKLDRLAILQDYPKFTFNKTALEDREGISKILIQDGIDCVIHLAAQSGIRVPVNEAQRYIDSNLVGFWNILDCCRLSKIQHLVYASSSSVYGDQSEIPFSTNNGVDHPQSIYAATKRANELLAHCYSHQWGLATTGLRFFTVYGPWGRPDMAVYKFVEKIVNCEVIEIFGNGDSARDFTYVDDAIEVIFETLERIPESGFSGDISPASSPAPYQILNVGTGHSTTINNLVTIIEDALNRMAEISHIESHPADMKITQADIGELKETIGFQPSTSLKTGIERFTEWYLEYKNID